MQTTHSRLEQERLGNFDLHTKASQQRFTERFCPHYEIAGLLAPENLFTNAQFSDKGRALSELVGKPHCIGFRQLEVAKSVGAWIMVPHAEPGTTAAMLDYLRTRLTALLLGAIVCRIFLATPIFPKHPAQLWHVLKAPRAELSAPSLAPSPAPSPVPPKRLVMWPTSEAVPTAKLPASSALQLYCTTN